MIRPRVLPELVTPARTAPPSAAGRWAHFIIIYTVFLVGPMFGLQDAISLIELRTSGFDQRGRGCRRNQIGDVSVRMSNDVAAVDKRPRRDDSHYSTGARPGSSRAQPSRSANKRAPGRVESQPPLRGFRETDAATESYARRHAIRASQP